MKRLVKIIRRTGIPGLCLLLLLGLMISADAAAQGSIRVILRDEKEAVPEVGFELYRVGTAGTGAPEFDKKYGITGYPQTAEETEAAIAEIEKKLNEKPLQSEVTDAAGIVDFTGLEPGVYYVAAKADNSYGKIMPCLVQLPYYEIEDGQVSGPCYQAQVWPKSEPDKEEPEEPKEPEVPDKEKPTAPGKKTNTKTGDLARTGLYLSILVSCLFLLTGIIMKNVRRRNE